MAVARLGPQQRAAALARMAGEPFDVLVVGGGVTGAGAALDAATRGLSVALVEARDWAAGTSSRSSKLIHGGLRYLEQFNFPLVYEALRERGLMLSRLCPHLVRPVPFLFPLTRRVGQRLYVGAGVTLYDLMAAASRHGRLPHHRHLTRRGALRLAPGLRPDAVVGAVQYWDGHVDDARHTMTVVRTAVDYGAAAASSARVVAVLADGGRVRGARVRDLESGAEIDVRARAVVGATGVWVEDLQRMAQAAALPVTGGLRVRASKGVHLVVAHDRVDARTGMILRADQRVLFVIPWPEPVAPRHWIVGTTDTPWELGRAHPAASRADIDYLLERVNGVLARPLGVGDIEGVYAGLRPLLHGRSKDTSRLSREHAVSEAAPGLVSVAGGKYTTYRVMAADAVDAAVRHLGRPVPGSCTARIPLAGAVGLAEVRAGRARLAEASGLDAGQIERLVRRYGSCVDELLALADARPELKAPLPGAAPYLAVEALYAVSHEGALHLDDILTRRLRVSIESRDRGVAAAGAVADLAGDVLGWDGATRRREVARYHERVAAERASQAQPDDVAAASARLGAADSRLGP